MTSTPKGFGSVKAFEDEWIDVEPSYIDAGGVFLDLSTTAVWLSEKEAKRLRKLIKEAIKVGSVDG